MKKKGDLVEDSLHKPEQTGVQAKAKSGPDPEEAKALKSCPQ